MMSESLLLLKPLGETSWDIISCSSRKLSLEGATCAGAAKALEMGTAMGAASMLCAGASSRARLDGGWAWASSSLLQSTGSA